MYNDEFHEYLLGISAEAAEAYIRLHPPPVPPVEAIADIRAQAQASHQIPTTPWYGLRHRLMLTCAQEWSRSYDLTCNYRVQSGSIVAPEDTRVHPLDGHADEIATIEERQVRFKYHI
jgi:hypothetical protein